MYFTIAIEDLRKPAILLGSKDFLLEAKLVASGKKMPGLRMVPETIPLDCTVMEEIESGVSAVMDDIIAALTQPLTDEEKSPQPAKAEKLPRIAFKGYLDEVNQFFYKRGWTDGLPIIPPTDEAVSQMLMGTDLPANHVVGNILPRLGIATVEKIAINAVMAGALPTYMPLLIAAVQALTDQRACFSAWGISTGSFSPFWIINGPIYKDLNINNGSGALSPGNIANSAIGRAMGLIILNIGGARKGIEDMGTFGNPAKNSMVIAENEEANPWEPLHVEQGYSKEDSTITLCFPNCISQVKPYGSDDKGILNAAISNIIPGRAGPFSILISPSNARILSEKGWTKKKIAAFISEHATVPANRHPSYYGAATRIEGQQTSSPNDSKPILNNLSWIKSIVFGGPGNLVGLVAAQHNAGEDWVTKRIELPKNWDSLLIKYKDIVPKYIL
ncbi:hypothetical protein ACFLXD_00755 [Chloroflexota bacterium]